MVSAAQVLVKLLVSLSIVDMPSFASVFETDKWQCKQKYVHLKIIKLPLQTKCDWHEHEKWKLMYHL